MAVLWGVRIPDFRPAFLFCKYCTLKLGISAHAFNPRTWWVCRHFYVWVWGQPGLHIEFQASCGYMVSLKVNKQTACINVFFVKVKYCHFIKFLKQALESVSLIHQYCSYFVLWQKYNIPGSLEAFKHTPVSRFRAQSLSTTLRVFYDTISLIFYKENLKLDRELCSF